LAAGVVVFCAAAWPFTRAHLQAVAVLDEVAGSPCRGGAAGDGAGDDGGLQLPAESAAGQQIVRARLLLAAGQAECAAMVVFHGVHHLGIDEPRLMGFAAAMASCGIRVLTPELPDIKDYHVSADSVRTIGESAKWYAGRRAGRWG